MHAHHSFFDISITLLKIIIYFFQNWNFRKRTISDIDNVSSTNYKVVIRLQDVNFQYQLDRRSDVILVFPKPEQQFTIF